MKGIPMFAVGLGLCLSTKRPPGTASALTLLGAVRVEVPNAPGAGAQGATVHDMEGGRMEPAVGHTFGESLEFPLSILRPRGRRL